MGWACQVLYWAQRVWKRREVATAGNFFLLSGSQRPTGFKKWVWTVIWYWVSVWSCIPHLSCAFVWRCRLYRKINHWVYECTLGGFYLKTYLFLWCKAIATGCAIRKFADLLCWFLPYALGKSSEPREWTDSIHVGCDFFVALWAPCKFAKCAQPANASFEI